MLRRLARFFSYLRNCSTAAGRRIRKDGGIEKQDGQLGGEGKIIEADETYYGKYDEPRERKTKRYTKPTEAGRSGPADKRAIVASVERDGKSRTFHVARADKETAAKIVCENVHPDSRLRTDKSRPYSGASAHAAAHETVRHSDGEYARDDVNTNSASSGCSKKGITGVYQPVNHPDGWNPSPALAGLGLRVAAPRKLILVLFGGVPIMRLIVSSRRRATFSGGSSLFASSCLLIG